jgi:hypothetical protein
MNAETMGTDPVTTLDQQLQAGAARANFDMDDTPELPWLKPFPQLYNAVAWLDEHVTTRWREADAEAIRHQIRHQWLARMAVATGVGAIILAVVLLALKQSWPESIAAVVWIEGITVLAGVISVGMGLWAKSDRKWLGCRHRAERLRMLKFRALARTELWSGQDALWRAWVENEIATLPAPDDLDHMENWSREDTAESESPSVGTLSAEPATRRALAAYYRHKRLLNQADYFDRKGKQAGASWALGMHHHRERLFFTTIGFVLFHFVADYLAGRMEDQHLGGVAHAWELVSLWSIVLAAVLPVAGIGVRAWSAAFELSRKARSFAAKHQAMHKAVARLGNGTDELRVILAHLRHDELFLEQEHREWLRLLLDAEWFL